MLWEEGFYCPQGSTTSKGEPTSCSGGCGAGTKCACNVFKKYCPPGSTTEEGAPAVADNKIGKTTLNVSLFGVGGSCNCPIGFFCTNGKKQACSAGKVCDTKGLTVQPDTECAEGFFCPKTSTSSQGNPVVGPEDSPQKRITVYKEVSCVCEKEFFKIFLVCFV